MSHIKDQIEETWYINHRINLLLIDSITEESLFFTTSKRGGGTIGHQLAHIYNVRFWKLESIKRVLVSDLTTIKAEDIKTKDMLKQYHKISTDLVAIVLREGADNNGVIKGFKRGIIALLGYFIAHESHHRGNILLTLKLSGFRLPDELKYGIWEWNKI